MDEVPLWTFILIQLAVILINAVLAVQGVSIRSLNNGVVRKLAEDGDKDAINMLHIDNINTKLNCALGFTVAFINILGGAFAVYPISLSVARELSTLIGAGTVIEVIFTIFFAFIIEMLTFSLGVLLPERVAEVKATEKSEKSRQNAVLRLYLFLKPVVFIMIKLSKAASTLFGISSKNEEPEVTEDEILMMVDKGEETGTIESNEKEMIENVFNFSSTTASDVMTHRRDVIAICIDDSEEEILNTIIETGKSRFPVYSDDIDKIEGILIARDYLINMNSKDRKPLRELLRSEYLVPETVKTNVLFKDMQSQNIHMAVVVDEYGGTAGIVTLEDLLEEIVGNIYDEFDEDDEDTSIIKIEENLWRVAGNVDMETFTNELQISYDEDAEYDTVGGLVLSQLSSIPEDSSHPEVYVNGLYIYVETISNRRIEWVLVSQIMGPEKEPDEDEEDED